jgi:hypothetical protein
MNQNEICIGDEVARSPNGEGVVTGISRDGFAEVNGLAVAWCARTDGRVYNPRGIGGQAGDLVLGASSWKQPEEVVVTVPVGTFDAFQQAVRVATFDEFQAAVLAGAQKIVVTDAVAFVAPGAAVAQGAAAPEGDLPGESGTDPYTWYPSLGKGMARPPMHAPAQAPAEPQAPAVAVAAPVVPPPAPAEPPAAPTPPPETVAPVQHTGAETPQAETPQDGVLENDGPELFRHVGHGEFEPIPQPPHQDNTGETF